MATAVFRKKDLNRYAKAYPFLRKEPKWTYVADSPVILESAVVSFNGLNMVTYTFVNPYTNVPIVVATPQNDSFSVFVSAVTTTQVTIGASVFTNETASIFVVTE